MILSAHTSNGGPLVARPQPLSTHGMLKLLRKRLREVLKRGARKIRGGVRDVHRLRVSTRKARAALTICRPLIANAVAKQIDRSLKSQRRVLGQVRDWDVLIARTLCTPADDKAEARCDLLYFLSRQRRRAWRAALITLSDKHNTVNLEDAIRQIHQKRPRRSQHPSAHDLFRAALREPLDAIGSNVGIHRQVISTEIKALHELRISLKELRYLLEFRDEITQSAYPAPQLALLAEAQERLGEIHDLSRRPELLKSAKRPKIKSVSTWITETTTAATARLDDEVNRFLAWQQNARLLEQLQEIES